MSKTSAKQDALPPLPVDAVMGDLLAALAARSEAVLVAPPGAGKTTRVPLALLDEPWTAGGRILVLEPRRLAARGPAHHVADLLGEKVGDTAGYRVRHESRIGKATRIEYVTAGIFTRMILDDPTLDGIAAVLFDEFHERSIDNDLGLALARDAQQGLRPDLRLLPMSATMDGASVSRLLGDAPVIESRGRSFPVEMHYRPRTPNQPIEEAMERAILAALSSESGSLLCFLPGQGEIRRVHERLAASGRIPAGVAVHPLYGALDPAAQNAAIAPARDGARKIVLATAIAETSITIDGVTTVIDSGLARVARHDAAAGISRLETVRASLASVNQRAGRAGRTAPGRAIRLWQEAQTASLPEQERPEILEADLSAMVLDLSEWGVSDPSQLAWLDPPPPSRWQAAIGDLQAIGALDAGSLLTPFGRGMRRLPVDPPLAAMLLVTAGGDMAASAALVAALLSEPGAGGRSVDIAHRLSRVQNDRSPRSEMLRAFARRLTDLAAKQPVAGRPSSGMPGSIGGLIALAYPDRVAMQMGPGMDGSISFRLANGRRARLDATERLAGEPMLAIADLQGSAASARILAAAAIDAEEVRGLFSGRIEQSREVRLDRPSGSFRAREVERFGRLVLAARNVPLEKDDSVEQALMEAIREDGLSRSLPAMALAEASELRARLGFAYLHLPAQYPPVDDASLETDLEDWLLPMVHGTRGLAGITARMIHDGLAFRAGHEAMQLLDEIAPADWPLPTGRRAKIAYDQAGQAVLSVRAQELYSMTQHPLIASRLLEEPLPVTVELLSPAMRPIQTTRDLPGFWRGNWSEVRKEMRGRYPKHFWPEDPASAPATTRTRPGI